MAKSTKVTGWRSRSSGFLAAVAAAALIVVLLAGMALGYEIEKSRVKSSTKTTAAAKKRAKSAKKGSGKSAKGGSLIVLFGTVSGTKTKSITLTPKKGPARTVGLSKTTAVFRADAGAASDIAVNSRVVVIPPRQFSKHAALIIVQPKSAPFGNMVTAATATTVSTRTGKKTQTFTTNGSAVEKTSPAALANVTKGTKVLISALRLKSGIVVATEIIVLPSSGPSQ